MIQWDKCETFSASDGTPGIRYAISDRDGVTYEFSMHDPTIKSMVSRDRWLPVHSSPTNCANINQIDGKLIVLCGFGKPNEPVGNLLMMRVGSRPGFSQDRMTQIISLILFTLAGFGIQFNKAKFEKFAFTGN